jgi:nitrogen fixation NifU-like protein
MSAELYQSLIMDRSRAPRFAGAPASYTATASGKNPLCGDETTVFVTHDGTVRHTSSGCAILLASADLMAEAATGLNPTQIATLHQAFEATVTTGAANAQLGNLNALAGVHEYRSRLRCATLPWAALQDALQGDA